MNKIFLVNCTKLLRTGFSNSLPNTSLHFVEIWVQLVEVQLFFLDIYYIILHYFFLLFRYFRSLDIWIKSQFQWFHVLKFFLRFGKKSQEKQNACP